MAKAKSTKSKSAKSKSTEKTADILASFTAEIHSTALKGGGGSDMPQNAWKVSNAGKTAQRKITLNLPALKDATAVIIREISGAVYFKVADSAEIADDKTPTQAITWRNSLAVISANKKLMRALGVKSSDSSNPKALYTYKITETAKDDKGNPILWEFSTARTDSDDSADKGDK